MQIIAISGSNIRVEPWTTGLTATCPQCGEQVFSKVGEVKIAHWSHYSNTNCTSKNKTDWHCFWQSLFDPDNIEVVSNDHQNTRHVADVRYNIVMEIQHSKISQEEIDSRELHYFDMIWLIDEDFYYGQILKNKIKFKNPWFIDAHPKYVFQKTNKPGEGLKVSKFSKFSFVKCFKYALDLADFEKRLNTIKERASVDDINNIPLQYL